MLAKRIIACLDCKDGKVIKGKRFAHHEEVGEINELAHRYSEIGMDELVLYDITASSRQQSVNASIIRSISKTLRIPFSVAGGINSIHKAEKILQSGAEKISINSPAIQHPSLIDQFAKEFGSQALVVGIDTKKVDGLDRIYQFTGDINASKQAPKELFEWIDEVVDRGAGEIVINTIQQDGMRSGYDIALLRKVRKAVNIPIIASGGAGQPAHFVDVFQQAEVDGALAASIFHKQELSPQQIKNELQQHGIHVRNNL